jgi:hypothetical protein
VNEHYGNIRELFEDEAQTGGKLEHWESLASNACYMLSPSDPKTPKSIRLSISYNGHLTLMRSKCRIMTRSR